MSVANPHGFLGPKQLHFCEVLATVYSHDETNFHYDWRSDA